MFDRLYLNFDKELVNKIRNVTVLIIGLGGVGGSCLETLIRYGVNNFILVDNDIFEESNLNRQLLSNINVLGKKKVSVAKERILSINKDANVICIDEFITKDNIDKLFNYNIDYIIDACDTVSTKELLIRKSLDKNIKIISSMGMGNKINPFKLELTDLKKTSYDPIAKVLRLKFKNEKRKIMVISSKEEPIKCDGLGSSFIVPNICGILLSNYVITDIKEQYGRFNI